MFWYLFGLAVFLCFLHIVFNYNDKARKIRKLPGPDDSFIVGNAQALMLSSVELMRLARKLAKDNSGIYRIWMFPLGAVNLYNPDDVETVISNMKFNDKSEVYKVLKPWLRDGLLVSKGSKWQQRRKILTPTFHFNILRQFFHVIEENCQSLVDSLEKVAGRPVDVGPILSEFTLNSICETAMGTQLSDESLDGKSYKDAIHNLGCIFYQRFINVFYFFDFTFNFTPLSRRHNRYLKTVHEFTKNVIEERKKYIEKNGVKVADPIAEYDDINVYKNKKKIAMLDLLLSANKEGLIDNIGIQEEVDTFMFEGHDTTASGLSFCFMILANHSNAQDKIYEELMDIFGDSKRPVTIEDLPKMKYLERCIKESLRLYPPVHFISRNLHETVTLSNYTIPGGTFCHINIYDLHRNPKIFKNPDEFDPDRFLPENSVGRHPYAYIPFSAGPRNCIGQKFAIMEMKMAVARVLREFKLEPLTRPEDIKVIADIVLRNEGPVEVTFTKRQ